MITELKAYKRDLIIQNCIERWKLTKEESVDLRKAIEVWLSQVKCDATLEVLGNLLEAFEYFTRTRANTILKELHTKTAEKYGDDYAEKASFFPFSKDSDNRMKSSHMFLIEYGSINGIDSGNFYVDISKCVREVRSSELIVFVDDILGTGDTLKSFLSNKIKILRGKQVLVEVIVCSERARKKLEGFAKQNSINIDIISWIDMKCAFDENYIFESPQASKKLIENLEKSICKNSDEFVLGYQRAQALVAFFRNCPNVTLSCFWRECDNPLWNPLFPRKHIKDFTRSKENKSLIKNNLIGRSR